MQIPDMLQTVYFMLKYTSNDHVRPLHLWKIRTVLHCNVEFTKTPDVNKQAKTWQNTFSVVMLLLCQRECLLRAVRIPQ